MHCAPARSRIQEPIDDEACRIDRRELDDQKRAPAHCARARLTLKAGCRLDVACHPQTGAAGERRGEGEPMLDRRSAPSHHPPIMPYRPQSASAVRSHGHARRSRALYAPAIEAGTAETSGLGSRERDRPRRGARISLPRIDRRAMTIKKSRRFPIGSLRIRRSISPALAGVTRAAIGVTLYFLYRALGSGAPFVALASSSLASSSLTSRKTRRSPLGCGVRVAAEQFY